MTPSNELSTRCCIVGGGPCGVMLGVLLARAGVDVVVLEKYPDFFRDFRGDTIHPLTLQLLYELGWLDEFLKLPHSELREVGVEIAGQFDTRRRFFEAAHALQVRRVHAPVGFSDFLVSKADGIRPSAFSMATPAPICRIRRANDGRSGRYRFG